MSEQINIDELEQVAAQAAGPQLGGANFTMAELKFRATFDPMTVLTLINQLRALGDRAMHLERRLSDVNGEVLRLKGADQHAQRLQAGHDEAVMRAQVLEQERDALAAKLKELEGQEPVAWVDVKDSYEGPYNFEGMKLLADGKHHLFARPVPAEPVNARLLTAARAAVAFIEGKPNAVEPFGLLRAAISAAEAQQATWGKGFALVPKRLTRAMNDLLSEEGWEWADLLAAAEAITEEEYAALVADENTEPVRLTRESVARAIWGVRREYEDRCDMELEDMGESHPVWDEADAVLAAAELTQTDPAWLTIEQAKNAERYAYLRSQHEGSVAASFAVFAPEQPIGEFGPVGSMPGELDAAIDSAMRADSHKVEG